MKEELPLLRDGVFVRRVGVRRFGSEVHAPATARLALRVCLSSPTLAGRLTVQSPMVTPAAQLHTLRRTPSLPTLTVPVRTKTCFPFPLPCGPYGNKCGCGCLPPPCNQPPRCIQFMTGYYYYPYGWWFCGPYHVQGTSCPTGGGCGCSCVGCKGPCGPCCVMPDTGLMGTPGSPALQKGKIRTGPATTKTTMAKMPAKTWTATNKSVNKAAKLNCKTASPDVANAQPAGHLTNFMPFSMVMSQMGSDVLARPPAVMKPPRSLPPTEGFCTTTLNLLKPRSLRAGERRFSTKPAPAEDLCFKAYEL